MINELLQNVLKSGAGAELLKQVQEKGLSADQATSALKATAEGVMEQGGAGGLASLASGMLGGGGLASMAGGLLGGGPANAGPSSLTAMVPGIAQFVAQKTGLDPAMASTVVTMALPKVIELVKSHMGASGADAAKPGGLLGSLL